MNHFNNRGDKKNILSNLLKLLNKITYLILNKQ